MQISKDNNQQQFPFKSSLKISQSTRFRGISLGTQYEILKAIVATLHLYKPLFWPVKDILCVEIEDDYHKAMVEKAYLG